MKCIIIDDEPLALNIIKSYCEDLGTIEVVGIFTNALEALNIINNANIDLVFSDIEMPQINGIDFIKALDHKPLFIFTTAYSQYAIEGFELNAVDYLVKPIPFPRFIKAVNRAKEIFEFKNNNKTPDIAKKPPESITAPDQFIFVKSEYENIKIELGLIKYIEGLKDYLKIHITTGKPKLTLMSFKAIQSKLPENNFIRIHRSFIVNINYIETVQKSKVIIDTTRIPIGESYKADFLRRIGI
ncbi:DNA-binding response regulator [Aquimarina sp. AD1]|uniref:LytR/AlgR family response regulator transcription factor n=1 Tax=Aquimarina sp. (strain AD1) TaxID=1714848 RepID=UPI000E498BA4|nr:LytTR family DNA-binding domain-containing protein [Aquimarina sp. AD1]AXT58108.1 DNA-binding response regulator [Aquimarina sp. AD1]RKN04545.1 response regulator [Aquimarina sp. AD1]